MIKLKYPKDLVESCQMVIDNLSDWQETDDKVMIEKELFKLDGIIRHTRNELEYIR